MPEAVIVATARTPIGRAFKGSFVNDRADDMAAFIVDAALKKLPELDRHDGRRPHARLRAPRRRAGLQHGSGRRGPRRDAPGARLHDHPVLLELAADDAHGRARDHRRARATCSSPRASRR